MRVRVRVRVRVRIRMRVRAEGLELASHACKVPEVEVVVGRARHETAAGRVEGEARDRLGVRLEGDLVGDRHLHRLLQLVVVVVVVRAEDLVKG